MLSPLVVWINIRFELLVASCAQSYGHELSLSQVEMWHVVLHHMWAQPMLKPHSLGLKYLPSSLGRAILRRDSYGRTASYKSIRNEDISERGHED
jgi:hypothetical protein